MKGSIPSHVTNYIVLENLSQSSNPLSGANLYTGNTMQKTSKQWVEEVSKDPAKLQHWLERQYIGEELAARRLEEFFNEEGF